MGHKTTEHALRGDLLNSLRECTLLYWLLKGHRMPVDNHPYLSITMVAARGRSESYLRIVPWPKSLAASATICLTLRRYNSLGFRPPLAAGRRLVPLGHHNISDRSRLRERFLFS